MHWDDMPRLWRADVIFYKNKVNGLGRFFKWVGSFVIRFGSDTAEDAASPIPAVRHAHTNHSTTATGLWGRIPEDGRLLYDNQNAEALGGGFTFRWMREHYENEHSEVAVFRHKHMTDHDRKQAVMGMLHLRDKRYGYGKIVAHGIDFALTRFWNRLGFRGDVYAARWLARSEHYPMCWWAVQYVYSEKWGNHPFPSDVVMGAPDNGWDHIVQSDDWVLVWATDGFEELLTREV